MKVKVMLDINEENQRFTNAVENLFRYNETLPEEEQFCLEEGESYAFDDDYISTYDTDLPFIIFDTKKDYMCEVNNGDATCFFIGKKPIKLEKTKTINVSYYWR